MNFNENAEHQMIIIKLLQKKSSVVRKFDAKIVK